MYVCIVCVYVCMCICVCVNETGTTRIYNSLARSHNTAAVETKHGNLCFPTISHKRRDFREKTVEHKMCFDFLYILYLKRGARWRSG